MEGETRATTFRFTDKLPCNISLTVRAHFVARAEPCDAESPVRTVHQGRSDGVVGHASVPEEVRDDAAVQTDRHFQGLSGVGDGIAFESWIGKRRRRSRRQGQTSSVWGGEFDGVASQIVIVIFYYHPIIVLTAIFLFLAPSLRGVV